MKILLKNIFILSICFLILPGILKAQIEIKNPLRYNTIEELIEAITNFMFILSIAIAPIAILIGAFYILSAGADPKRVGIGKTIIFYTLIGVLIIFFAKGLIALIKQVLGV